MKHCLFFGKWSSYCNPRKWILFPLVVLFSLLSAYSQGVDDEKDLPIDTAQIISVLPEENWDLFGREDLVELSLIFDVKSFLKSKNAENYLDARLLIHMNENDTIEKQVRIKTRGNFRQRFCYFPPIKLNLKGTEFNNEYLGQQTTLKFVTHCKSPDKYENYLLREYLIYKLYNVLTDYSFRVRLMQVRYVDSEDHRKPLVKYGFLIEHLNSVALRNNAMRIDNEKLSQRLMDPMGMARMALFHYMIGNNDWSVTGMHNVKILKENDFRIENPQPVPYDFDYSGMVNAEYAAPMEHLGLKTVRDRLYRGICLSEDVTDATIRLFLEKKMELYDVINDFDLLSKRDKKDMIEYLDGFFRILDSNFLIQRDIYSTCIEQ